MTHPTYTHPGVNAAMLRISRSVIKRLKWIREIERCRAEHDMRGEVIAFICHAQAFTEWANALAELQRVNRRVV